MSATAASTASPSADAESARCSTCGGPLEAGFVSTSNGSGLFWSRDAEAHRLRPHGLEVLVPTGFEGTYSANLPGDRCHSCGTILLRVPKPR